jgi:hypothetical protein
VSEKRKPCCIRAPRVDGLCWRCAYARDKDAILAKLGRIRQQLSPEEEK